jgi:hypothetical protein
MSQREWQCDDGQWPELQSSLLRWTMFSVRQDVCCCLHGFLSLIATVRNIVTGFPHRFVKIREVTPLILSRKCCISICPISSLYIAEILVMNVLAVTENFTVRLLFIPYK